MIDKFSKYLEFEKFTLKFFKKRKILKNKVKFFKKRNILKIVRANLKKNANFLKCSQIYQKIKTCTRKFLGKKQKILSNVHAYFLKDAKFRNMYAGNFFKKRKLMTNVQAFKKTQNLFKKMNSIFSKIPKL